MTNNTTPTTLGKLEFADIKQSLTDYLRNQSVFSGYNFSGSAMQTMIDLMAYNTFYYAYYANMINAEAFLDSAQKEESMISLCKPLGFAVPSRTCARAEIQVNSLPNNNPIPAATAFIASDSNGTEYRFYNLTEIPVVDNGTEKFTVYEGSRYIEFDAIPTFDYDNQRISIAADGFDLSTISVTVTERIADTDTTMTEIWTPVQNIGYTSRVDENIYFVERTSTGFSIVFGSANSVGRSIDSSITKILVRYLLTNGSRANNLNLFRNTLGGAVTALSASSAGRDSPDLDEVRFLAPKWFAAQERAVTVNDYKALLLQSGYFASQYDFNVYGGQDLNPPRYGRVFITSSLTPDNPKVSEIINFLKERSVITILPEYATAKDLNVFVDFNFSLGPGTPNTAENRSTILAIVKSAFQTNFAKTAQFNVSFSAADFIQYLREYPNNPDINSLIISPDNFQIYVSESIVSDTEYNFSFKNQLYLPLASRVEITEPFTCTLIDSNTGLGVLKIYATSSAQKNQLLNLELWRRPADGTDDVFVTSSPDIGTYIANAGNITIKKDVISSTADLKVYFQNKSFVSNTEYKVTLTYGNVVLN